MHQYFPKQCTQKLALLCLERRYREDRKALPSSLEKLRADPDLLHSTMNALFLKVRSSCFPRCTSERRMEF